MPPTFAEHCDKKIGAAVAEQRIKPAHFNFGVFKP
jgi:hypothetical protein